MQFASSWVWDLRGGTKLWGFTELLASTVQPPIHPSILLFSFTWQEASSEERDQGMFILQFYINMAWAWAKVRDMVSEQNEAAFDILVLASPYLLINPPPSPLSHPFSFPP